MDQPLDLAPVRIETTHPDSPRPGERSEITKARRVGHAITRNESFAGAAGVGVPIIGTDGLAIGSISVAWLGDELDETSAAHAYAAATARSSCVTQPMARGSQLSGALPRACPQPNVQSTMTFLRAVSRTLSS